MTRRKLIDGTHIDYLQSTNVVWLSNQVKEYRDGQKAVSSAKKAMGIYTKHYVLDTPAADYAETSDFEMAVKIEQKAYAMKNRPEYKNMIEAYKKGWTYSEHLRRKNQ